MCLRRSLVVVAFAAVSLATAACDPPIALAEATTLRINVPLPPLTRVDGAPPLTASIEVPGLLDAPLLVTTTDDGDVATGSFAFSVDAASTVAALLRVKGQLSPADDVATLVVADLSLDVAPGTEIEVSDVGEFSSAATAERPWLDLNRNQRDNRADYEAGCDPAVAPSFLRVSETTLQLVRSGDRAVIVVDNVIARAVSIDVAVVDAPGVGVDIIGGDGEATSLAELHGLELGAGQSLIVAVSFAAIDEFFSQGLIVISGRDNVDDGACQQSLTAPVRVVANIAGLARRATDGAVAPTPVAIGGLSADDIVAADLDHLASGIPVNVDLNAAGNGRRIELADGTSVAADGAFAVTVPADGRLDVALGEAAFDVDINVVGVKDGEVIVIKSDVLPAGNVEALRLRSPDDFVGVTGDVVVAVGPSGATEPATLNDDELRATVPVTLRTTTSPRLLRRPAPSHGSVEGGTVVVIGGEGLKDDGEVFFGARRAVCTVTDVVAATAADPTQELSCVTPRGTLNAGANPTDVVYVDVATGERATLTASFRFDPSTPRIDSIEPSVIVVGADAALTLHGFGFVDPLQLDIGGQRVPATVVNDTTIFADAPALEAGAKDVVVTVFADDGTPFSVTQTGGVLYVADDVPPPALSSVFPSSGDVVGGATVNLAGSGFGAGARVFFVGDAGEVEADVVFVGATTIIATTPASAPGLVDVRVENADGQSSTLTDAFSFTVAAVPPPVIFTLVPSTGSTAGGETVTVLGDHFDDGATVSFDGIAAVVDSRGAAALVVTAPAHAEGTVNVVVENSDAQQATATAAYSYLAPVVPPPQVFSISPNTSPTAGGVVVTVLGDHFAGASVTLDGAPITLTSASAGSLVFTSPAHAAGAGDIVVTNADQQQARVQNAFAWRDDVVGVRNPVVVDVSPGVVHALVGGETLRLIGSDLDQTTGATVVVGAARVAAVVRSSSASLVVVDVAAALPAGIAHVELVDAETGAHNSPDVVIAEPVPVEQSISGRAQDDAAFTVLVAGADLNPAKLSGVRFTPLDARSGVEQTFAAAFTSETLVTVDVASGALGQGGWVTALVYGSGATAVVVPVDTVEVGGFCPGAALCDLCGNNVRDPGEDCDGTDFGGESCVGNGFSGGTLSCSGCQFDFNQCAQCGNGLVEIGEQCDGANLNLQTCTLRGFTAGTLACAGTCLFDTTACRTCGDGVCSTGETTANCAADCPASCGTGGCTAGETCHSCPRDCNTCAPYRMALVAGDNQQTRITETFAGAVRVRIIDDNNNPVPGADVTFNPEPGDVTSFATRVTDNNGEALVSWTPGVRPGTHQLVIAATARDGAAITGQPFTLTDVVNDVAAGTVVHVAGNLDGSPTTGAIGNKAALRTGLQAIVGVAVEPGGDLLLLDARRLTRLRLPEGVYEHVAGDATATQLASTDQNDGDGGPAISARFVTATDVAVDPNSGVIYVADSTGTFSNIRRIGLDGVISTVAGGGAANSAPNDGDGGPATAAHFEVIKGLDVDDNGDLIVAETTRMRRVLLNRANPTTQTLLFTPSQIGAIVGGSVNGGVGHPVALPGGGAAVVITTNQTGFSNVIGFVGAAGGSSIARQTSVISGDICVGSDGAFYGGSNANFRYFRHDGVGGSAVIIGTGVSGQSGDLGPASSSPIGQPGPCGVDAGGNLFFIDKGGSGALARVRMVRSAALSSPLAVNLRVRSGDNQTALAGAALPSSLVFELVTNVAGPTAAVDGTLLGFTSSQGGTFAGATGLSTTVGLAAGVRVGRTVGARGATAAVPVTSSLVGVLGTVYPTTATANLTLRLPTTGETATWLNGSASALGGTLSTAAANLNSGGVFGNPFVADDGHLVLVNFGPPSPNNSTAQHSIFIVDSAGAVVRVAGGGTDLVDVGDGRPALSATLSSPVTAIEDDAGNIFVSDQSLRNVRIITPDGIIDRYAGGGATTTTPVDARSLQLTGPHRLAVADDGDLFVGDNSGVFVVDSATREARLVVAEAASCNSSTLTLLSSRALVVTRPPTGGTPVVVGRVNNANAACPLASGHYLFDVVNNQLVLPPRATLFAGATSENIIAAAFDGDGNFYWITELAQTHTVHRRSTTGVLSVVSGFSNPLGIASDAQAGFLYVSDDIGGSTVLRVAAP